MEGRRVIFLVIFSIHLAVVRVQENQITPTAVTRSSTRDSDIELQKNKVYTVPTTEAKYGPQNVELVYNRRSAPSTLNLTEGAGLELECETSCSPPCKIRWSKDDKVIQTYGRKKYLNITQIRRTQSGTYHCQARGVEGESSSEEVAVTVQYGPQNVKLVYNRRYAPSTLYLTEGVGLELMCETDCSPPCNIIWSRDDTIIPPYGRNKYLNITQIRRTHSGTYHCQARGAEGELSSEEVAVTVQYGPQNVKLMYNRQSAPSTLYLTEGAGLELKCETSCSPPCDIRWSRDDEVIQTYGRNKYLNLNQIRRSQSGTYHCQARGAEGELSSKEVSVTVQYGPNYVTIQYTSDREELWEGRGEITITCNADCNPRCNYWIRHNGIYVSTEKTYAFSMDRKKSGEYSCAASNSVSTFAIFSETMTLDIKYGPSNVTIQYTSDSEELWEGGGKITITCNADCNPRCNYWTLYHNGNWFYTQKTMSFIMDRENSGEYSCSARNSVQRTNVNSSNIVRLHIKYRAVRLSSIKKTISLEVNRDLPSNVVCTIDCNYEGCDSSSITVLRNSEVYHTIDTNQSIFPSRQAVVSDDGNYKCKLSDNTKSHENLQLTILYGPRNVRIMKDKENADAEIFLREWYNYTRLTCSSECNPACNISWYKDGKLLSYERNKIFSITSYRQHSGNYECKASGIEGTVSSKQVKITIHYSTNIVKVIPDSKVYYSRRGGRPLENITCQADCLPECTFTWKIENPYWSSQYGWESDFNKGDTLFANRTFQYNDYRRFKCVARNYVDNRESNWIRVYVTEGPDNVRITTKHSRGREHEPFQMECSATCKHGCLSYSWFHERKLTHSEELLHFNNLSRTDNGEYICAVTDYFGTTSKSYNLNVQYGPVNVSIQYTSDKENLIEGQGRVYLTCHADCNPTCSYTFYHNGQYKSLSRNGSMRKEKRNSGRYSCSAKNYVADSPKNSSNYVDIYIQYKPRLTVPDFPQIAAPGSLRLNLNVDSFPASNVTIFHKEEKLKFLSNFTGGKTYEINISTCLNGGKYRIVAENIIGNKSASKKLTVQCSPIILTSSNTTNKGFEIGDELNLTVKFMANPSPNASWTFVPLKGDMTKCVPKNITAAGKGFTSISVSNMNVNDFGSYQLTLSNRFGRYDKEFNIRGPPQPPTELTVDCSNTALIQWKPGFDGGSDQRFFIEYTTNVSSAWLSHNIHPVTADDASYLSTEINFLQPYVPYFFRIVTENRFGSRRSEKTVSCTMQSDSTMYDRSTDQDDVIDQIVTSSLSSAKTTNRRSIIRKEEILTLRAEREKYDQETKKLKEEAEYYKFKTMYLKMKMSQVNKENERGGGIL
ncbi:hemicentin-1-like isoform X2 [Ostrea edulis]|uniref:hemicentin-1-like isoform X2 n=1 Tax=Ostrea edulis TaxID=37623 RepID=UPI0024AE8E16|nr:hemicentin-1-like isoform X2 [Ostrea edulis]